MSGGDRVREEGQEAEDSKQMENRGGREERKGRAGGGVCEEGGREGGQEPSAKASVRDGHHRCASV